MVDAVCDWSVYKTPSSQTLRNRQAFYGLQRKAHEPIEQWLNRIQSSIRCCEFSTMFEFLLIDRFICGLNRSELKTLRCVRSWTVKRLVEMFSSQNIEDDPTEPNLADSEYIVSNQMLAVDVMKSEPVCSCTHFSLSMNQIPRNKISSIYCSMKKTIHTPIRLVNWQMRAMFLLKSNRILPKWSMSLWRIHHVISLQKQLLTRRPQSETLNPNG